MATAAVTARPDTFWKIDEKNLGIRNCHGDVREQQGLAHLGKPRVLAHQCSIVGVVSLSVDQCLVYRWLLRRYQQGHQRCDKIK